jgi:polar amino acid transport system substrate-binding protein
MDHPFKFAVRVMVGAGLVGAMLAGSGRAMAADIVPTARDALPEATRAAGVLRVATSLQWPPFDYSDEGGKPQGIDVRIVRLLGEKLGLRTEITDVKFPAIVPGITEGRFDVGVNQINITPERGKVVQFVAYFRSKEGLLVRRGVTDVDINNLCGRSLALTQGSAQIALAETLSKQCVASGKKEITLLYYPDSADTYLAVANGRGDGFLTSIAVGIYIAAHNDNLSMTKASLAGFENINAILVDKKNDALTAALKIALKSAISDGSYAAILKEFDVADAALTAEEVEHPPQGH